MRIILWILGILNLIFGAGNVWFGFYGPTMSLRPLNLVVGIGGLIVSVVVIWWAEMRE